MKIIMSTIFGLLVLINVGCNNVRPSSSDIVGGFDIKLQNTKSSLKLSLNCETETYCKLITTSQSEKRPSSRDVQYSNRVFQVEDLTIASNALKYAVDRKDVKVKRIVDAELMRRLSPSLTETQSIDKCWDLNIPEEKYTLACTFNENSSREKPIYLFVTDMGGRCGKVFCRYKIYTMTRR